MRHHIARRLYIGVVCRYRSFLCCFIVSFTSHCYVRRFLCAFPVPEYLLLCFSSFEPCWCPYFVYTFLLSKLITNAYQNTFLSDSDFMILWRICVQIYAYIPQKLRLILTPRNQNYEHVNMEFRNLQHHLDPWPQSYLYSKRLDDPQYSFRSYTFGFCSAFDPSLFILADLERYTLSWTHGVHVLVPLALALAPRVIWLVFFLHGQRCTDASLRYGVN